MDLFGGEAKRIHRKANIQSDPKARQMTLFSGLNAEPGQMNLFADDGIPDELVYQPPEIERALDKARRIRLSRSR